MIVRRREFITLLGSAAAICPIAAHAQQVAKVARIGLLGAASASGYASQLEAFRLGLRDLGYVEGKNIIIEYRWAEGRYDRLTVLAAELVGLKVDIILTHGTPGTLAAKRATAAIPIVMVVVGDAVASGLVDSIARPGGNVTGSSFFLPELSAKRLELLRTALPTASRLAILLNPGNAIHGFVRQEMDVMARALRLELQYVDVRGPNDFAPALASLPKGRAQGLVVVDDGMLIANVVGLVDLANRSGVPTIGFSELAEAGGLMSYGVSFPDIWRQAPTFVDKILKGARPRDLPIEQASRFELIINLKAAKALGLTIPSTLLQRADRVIE
jgi:putative ABC transport system substrate-binding protein